MSGRAEALAKRILDGAEGLAGYAEGLDAEQWAKPVPGDGRSVGVVVHHVASAYPIEVRLAQTIASGTAIEDVGWSDIHRMNAQHAADHADVSQAEAVELLRRNASEAATLVRRFSDEELDTAAPVSLNAGAPLTAQFFIEDHALRHSFHHLAKIREAF
ncbi:MAG: DinB family protein [Gemmatimonadota bacterium]|nr:DinB family protein [Gemmatimonadota bacterium]MDH5761026.1 DinB family protein [Gemmatimonadota bacterium]